MEIFIQIMKLAAGIGMFLFGMYLVEESLKNLSGRRFKLFLQRITKNNFGAVAGGAIVTAVMQSSSMVSFMVLAFVGAGVFTMKNALAIILGANLGTTIASWVVATLGFQTNIEVMAYPAVFMGGLLLILFGKRKSVKYLAYFLFGFGLLFIGLAFMKTAMASQVKTFDFAAYADMPLLVFLLIGFFITLLVQSSSVTMALTLSALHAGAIAFPAAAVIVLGSESGTTIKLLLSSIGGTASKKRVVLGNLLFNIVLTIVAFFLLKPILFLITDLIKISNPLIGLVTFSSLLNLGGILLFFPFLNPFIKFLERFFKDTDASASAFIGYANVAEPQSSLDLFKRETEYFIHNTMLFNLEQLETDFVWHPENSEFKKINERKKFLTKTPEEKYEFLKLLQGELQVFYISLRAKLGDEQNSELNQLVSAVRSAMHSAKSMKDIKPNITNLSHSSKDVKFELLNRLKQQTETLYKELNTLIRKPVKTSYERLQNTFKDIQNTYSSTLDNFYTAAKDAPLEDIDLTTAINFNRELFTSNKAMTMAVKDFLLNEKEAVNFNDIVVYLT